MLSQNERLLKAVKEKQKEAASAAKEVMDLCKSENRDRTEDEDAQVAEAHEMLEKLKTDEEYLSQQITVDKEILASAGGGIEFEEEVRVVQPTETQVASLGEQFIESKGYKDLLNGGMNAQSWSTGPVEIKGTFGATTTGPGTAMYQPELQPGIVQNLYQPPTIASRMGSGQTSSPIVRYVTESTTVTNAAAGVAAGGAKPESTLDFVQVDEPVRKIATFLPVQDEQLEDAVAIQSYINNRLSLFITLVEDQQLIRGAGGNDLQGVIGRTGVNTYGTAAGGTIPAEQIFKAANGVRGSSFLNPDTMVINPTTWGTIRLAKDTAGQYLGGGPWYGQYGNQGPASANRFSTGEQYWNLDVVVTSAIGVGTAVVGAFREGAAVIRRSGITVEATNSHSTYFANNLTAIRAEERLALAVYRPAAFVTITF